MTEPQEIKQQVPEVKISFRHKVQDWTVVLGAVWFILLLLGLGAFAFWGVEQGRDMLFAIIDDFKWKQFFLSLIALAGWGIQTGFGARVLILFSDISFYTDIPEEEGAEKQRKKTENEARVEHRKKIAERAPRVLFTIPFIIMFFGYLIAYINYDKYNPDAGNLRMLIAVMAFIAAAWFVTYILTYSLFEKQLMKRMDESAKRKLRALWQPRYMKELGPIRKLLYTAVGLALAIIIAYSFFPVSWLQTLGSVHIITMSFGCWIAVLYYIDYVDKRVPFLFLKYILLVVVLGISWYNDDHPVRRKTEVACKLPEQDVVKYFNAWYEHGQFPADTASVPIFFVSAEGGACRSGYWVSRVLAQIQQHETDFSKHVFSYSSVSGGTLGVNAFNAISQLEKIKSDTADTLRYINAVEKFYKKDFLAPITGRLVFAEAINLFSFHMFERFDRATSLETSWEESFYELAPANNLLEKCFNDVTGNGGPAIFINSTEVETGKRAILSNVKIDGYFNDAVSLQEKLNSNVRYSTAILFSARFPFFSPAAMIQPGKDTSERRHYVDGGYFENMGNITTMEIVNAIKKDSKYGKNVKPYVILITNDEEPKVKPLLFGNEALEPASAFMAVRSGHTNAAYTQIGSFICDSNSCDGRVIPFNMHLKGSLVPMNWFISDNAKYAIQGLMAKDSLYNASYGEVMLLLKTYEERMKEKTKTKAKK